jgi:hypothetical protein
MYHLELRKFPHNQCRFNLTEDDLAAILVPWVRGEWVRVGERNWNAHETRLTILEGPQLAPAELTMGRGWRTAQRKGTDVTREVLERARSAHRVATGAHDRSGQAEPGAASGAGRAEEVAGEQPAHDSGAPGGALLALLGAEPESLLTAWQRMAARMPEASPSERLAAAEEELAATQANEARASSG